MVKEKTRKQKKNIIQETAQKSLILHNDDVNTFDHVIECLVEICNHEPEQAEQCAMIVHYKGKCAIKSGPFEILLPMNEALLERGLTATIEE